ncbi:MAG TPA: carbon-nitrogen family hydrolase [Marmoricola sp.]|nr:carbon-nitrogen family hydrolase [Marmoricola sp.]
MRVAALQIASPDAESVDQRRARVDAQVRHETALTSCELLVLPELWAVGGFHYNEFRNAAEPFDGPSVQAAREWAALHDIHVHLGSFVEADGEHLFNTATVIAPDGDVVLKYRKVHLFGQNEASLMTPGDALAVAPVQELNLGIATCYDLRFPELFRSMVDAGANVLALGAAWPDARVEHWRLFTQARAVEEQLYVVACNAVGTHEGIFFSGGSRVVDPWGTVVAEADDQEGFLYADIDPTMPERVRSDFPVLADRRWTP